MKLSVAKQKSRLLAKKVELERSISGLSEAHPTPVTSTEAREGLHDTQDITTDFLEIQQEQSILVNQQALLALVKSALQRLERGTYGLCRQCGGEIPARRLEALPWAERCVSCEARLEQMYQSREDVYGAPQTF